MTQIEQLLSYFVDGDSSSNVHYYDAPSNEHFATYNGKKLSSIGFDRVNEQYSVRTIEGRWIDVTFFQLIRNTNIYRVEQVF